MVRALLALVVCGMGSPVALAQAVRYYEFPGAAAWGVSADGTTVVGTMGSQAFRWTESGGMQMLGAGFANSVSGDGSVVVGHSNGSIFRWDAVNGRVNIPGAIGWYPTISDAGNVIAYSASSGGGGGVYRWTPSTGVSALPSAAMLGSGVVSGDGSAIAGYGGIGQTVQPFRWTSQSGTTLLGALPGASLDGQATALSADGSVLFGAAATSDDVYDTFRWTSPTGMQALGVAGTASNVFNFPLPQDASGDGSILVGATFTRAFFWRQGYGPRFVSDVLHQDFGVDPTAILRQCRAVSADGRVLAGTGDNAAGGVAWIAILPSAIPSPGTGMLGVMGLAVIAMRRRRGEHAHRAYPVRRAD